MNEDSLLFVDTKESLIINQTDVYFSAREVEGDFLCLVSDGMGGHASGEIASHVVCDEFKKWFELLPEKVLQFSEDLISALSVKFLEIDRFINQEITTESRSPGATVVGILFLQTLGTFIFHAGDSRVYRRKGRDLATIHSRITMTIK
jgi:serine/threonine protein phosphatase PrpC